MSASGGSRRRTLLKTSVSKQYRSVELRWCPVASAPSIGINIRDESRQVVPVFQRTGHRRETRRPVARWPHIIGTNQSQYRAATPRHDDSLAPSDALDELGEAGLRLSHP